MQFIVEYEMKGSTGATQDERRGEKEFEMKGKVDHRMNEWCTHAENIESNIVPSIWRD